MTVPSMKTITAGDVVHALMDMEDAPGFTVDLKDVRGADGQVTGCVGTVTFFGDGEFSQVKIGVNTVPSVFGPLRTLVAWSEVYADGEESPATWGDRAGDQYAADMVDYVTTMITSRESGGLVPDKF